MQKRPALKQKGRAQFISIHLPAVSTVLADGFTVGSGLGFCVGNRGDNEYKPAGTYCKQNPASPAETAAVFCFCFCYRLYNNAVAATLGTNHMGLLSVLLNKQVEFCIA